MAQTLQSPPKTGESVRAWIVARRFGVDSEVWMRRQAEMMSRISPRIVCWERASGESGPDPCPVTVLGPGPSWDSGPGRWLTRLAGLPSGNCFGTRGEELVRLESLVREEKPAVMLCHFGHVALRMLPLGARAGVPIVAHFHGLDLSSMLRNRWYRMSLWRSLCRFAAAVVVGSHQRRLLIEHGMPEDRVHLIPCGVPAARFTPVERSSAVRPAPFRYIGVARLVEWKGPDHCVRALAGVVRRGVDARLDLVGDGPMKQSLQALADELGVGDRVRLLGSRSSDEVLSLLRESDVFLQHSLNASGCSEGFGVSIAEASACGLPVVVTRCGGIEDQVVHGETGLLVAQRDDEGMADAMAMLAGDPELCARLGEAGRRRVADRYDTAGQVRKLESVLLAAAGQPQGAAG